MKKRVLAGVLSMAMVLGSGAAVVPVMAEESTPASKLLEGKKIVYVNSNVNDDWNVISTKYPGSTGRRCWGECIIYNAEGDSAKTGTDG